VGFYLPLCSGVLTNFEGQDYDESVTGETISFNVIGSMNYLIYIGEYLDKTNLNQVQIQDTEARLDIYIDGYSQPGPIAKISIPF